MYTTVKVPVFLTLSIGDYHAVLILVKDIPQVCHYPIKEEKL